MAHKRVLAELSSKYGRPRPQTLGDYDKATAVHRQARGTDPTIRGGSTLRLPDRSTKRRWPPPQPGRALGWGRRLGEPAHDSTPKLH